METSFGTHWRCTALVCLLVLCFLPVGCANLLNDDQEEEDQFNLLLLTGLVVVASNPCFSQASPTRASAMHSASSLAGRTTIYGRIATLSGAPVISALVVAQSSTVNHFSTHSSVERNGSFVLSGLPSGATYKVAVESIDSDFNGRIDTHIGCFQSPSSFVDGWYAGDGATLVSSQAAGTSVPLLTANQFVNLGTILLNQ